MGKKILLADDSITIQKVIELTFSDEDFDVVTVGNGRLALERLAEVRPDIVLCDIIMPEKDGYEVCEQIKTNPAHAHIPVLLLTGAFEPFDQERAARAGYDGSLAKPFEPETLIAKVKDLLGRAPARSAPPAPRPVAAPPAAAVAPPVLPFPRVAAPAVPPPRPLPPGAASFIPDEPFGALDPAAFSEPATAPSTDAFAPMTEEESATLLAPPPEESASADAASTVMFRASDLPWGDPPLPPPAAPPVAAPVPVAAPEPEPVFVPEPAESVEEPPVFEEVLEEDLDFGATAFDAAPPAEQSFATLPPIPPEDDGSATDAFERMPSETTLAGGPAFEPTPEPVFEPTPAPVFERAPAAAVAPQPPESFADVAAAVAEPAPASPAPSEAAAMSVPVEMVEKIAQRVVAQISEKAVREIAWEVIPDLAEALIKQEIERLKAELQKT